MRQALVDEFGDSGPGRQKGWRINIHSHAAIAKRLLAEDLVLPVLRANYAAQTLNGPQIGAEKC